MGKRSRARERAFQILFQIDVGSVDIDEAIRTTLTETKMSPDTCSFTEELVRGTMTNVQYLDEVIARYAKGWSIDRMVNVDRSIIRMAAYEILFIRETPYKVTINEAVELAKKYGTEESSVFVNGILGGIVKERELSQADDC